MIDLIVLTIIVGSSIWVLIDARSIGVKKGQISGLGNMGPAGWFFACLLLWIVGFPMYLAKRPELKRVNQRSGGSVAATVIGVALISVLIGIIGLSFTGDIRMPTEDLQNVVRKSIDETWKRSPNLATIKVESFNLVHKSANQYEGLLGISADGNIEKLVVDVTYDGKQLIWKVRN